MMEDAENRTRRAPFVPLLMISLAVLAWAVFQSVMLVRDYNSFLKVRASQEPQMQAATKLRQTLQGIARDTAKLAEGGNAGAKLIVDQLRKRGVNINPPAPPPAQ
jgi:hypothetical protein